MGSECLLLVIFLLGFYISPGRSEVTLQNHQACSWKNSNPLFSPMLWDIFCLPISKIMSGLRNACNSFYILDSILFIWANLYAL